MSSPYHAGSRELQDRFDTHRLADRLDEKFMTRPIIDADDRAFIQRMDMFFLATADADGQPQCSYKGGNPGFVSVLDERTVAFPNYDGNGMYLSMGDLLLNPRVGMLFIDFISARPSRLSAQWHREHRRARRAARLISGRTVHSARHRRPGVPKLPALYPPDGARGTVTVRATRRSENADPRLEAIRVGL